MSSVLAPAEEVASPRVCSLVRGIKEVGSLWNLVVAAYLMDGPKRFNQILRMGESEGKDALNSRTLSRALKHLARTGFVERRVLGTQPVAVEYVLTEHGQKLKPLLEAYSALDPRAKQMERMRSR